MKPETQLCQPERLEAFLRGDLSELEEQQLTAHLESCESCRLLLDEAAAAPDQWHRTTAFLKDDPLDRSALSGLVDDPLAIQPQIQQVLGLLNASDDPHMLGRLASYEVSGVIGAGGMGIVLKAYERPLDRTVAIKVMAPYLATSGAARQRFSREARAAAAVIHPNVIAIYGVSTEGALPYLVMPYVAGASLQKRLDTEGALAVADVLRIGIQIASGLAAAHAQGLVHRDIKPANILLDPGVDRLVITDFGLARAVDDASVTRTGVIAGTPQYMSPEQARGEPVDARSDLFSLGSVLYAGCTGRVPFRADTPYGVLRRITDNEPRPIREINPLVPDWFCGIIERLHAKSMTDRFQSADEVAHLLTQCLAHVTQPTRHSLPIELRGKPQRSRIGSLSAKTIRLAWAGGLLATVSAGAWMALTHNEPPAATTSGAARSERADQPSLADSPAGSLAESEQTLERAGAAQADRMDQVMRPWDSPDATSGWNDNLSPLFQHIERTLNSDPSLAVGE